MEEALTTRLLADGGVSALVSDRVFPGRRPQASVLPAIVLNRVSGAPIYTDQGESGLVTARIQFYCWGTTFTSAKHTARAVIAAIVLKKSELSTESHDCPCTSKILFR